MGNFRRGCVWWVVGSAIIKPAWKNPLKGNIMHHQSITKWQHEHIFGQDKIRPGERNTLFVIVISATMMIVEIVAGIIFGSMSLLADGIHMGSHTVALSISALAYIYARKYADDKRFIFGTGKVNPLAGYTSAIILAVFALSMAWESFNRFIKPVEIAFNQAILVAIIGLVVNVVSVWILNRSHSPHHEAGQGRTHHEHSNGRSDYNLRSAYLHVLADALTSLLAIFALLGGKYFGLFWMDPLMGIVGAVLVARWSWGLLTETGKKLLDTQGSENIRKEIIEAIEHCDGNRISDFHVWSIGPDIYAAAISIVTAKPKPPEYYKRLIPNGIGLVHATIELHRCKN